MNKPANADVRMQGFTHRHTVQSALDWLDAQVRPLDPEVVDLAAAGGRVLSTPITSVVDVPAFDRATMDGYAVTAASTEGATPYNRMSLKVLGDALPGAPFTGTIGHRQAVRIMTGAPVPAGCDAVLPAESVDLEGPFGRGHYDVLAIGEVSPGKNIGRRGEDITAGTELLPARRVLRPQDLGVISSVGIGRVSVIRQPRIRLVVTGNELLPAGSPPEGFQITDANGPMLSALAYRDGGVVEFPGPVRDSEESILAGLLAEADVVIVSGGSSVGIEDLAPMLVASEGELAVHGIAMRPSSPTGLGRIGHRLVFLLPGNPVSALCAYDFFAGRAIRGLGGRPREWPYRPFRARLARKISSPVGRLDYARVRIVAGQVEPLSVSGASVLSSTTRADGFVIVPDDSEGFAAGADVDVWLY